MLHIRSFAPPLSFLAFLVAIGPLFNINLRSQSLEGLWIVEQVIAGDRVVTPRDRWFRYDEHGNFTSGNGWLQHSSGTYTYNKSDSTFIAAADFEPGDPYGAFVLWFEGEVMIWQRYENDILVSVKLKRTEVLPRSLADRIMGLWQLDSIIRPDGTATRLIDTNDSKILFLRWDREYRISNAEENTDRGYWHIHGHLPELTLISRSARQTFTSYDIIQNGEFLVLKLKDGADAGTRRYYQRVQELDIP